MGKTPEQMREYQRNWYAKNRTHCRAYARNWQNAKYRSDATHREKVRAVNKTRNHVTYRKLREQIYDLLGHECAHCGFTDKRALQVDHRNGGGAREIRANGWHWLKRVLVEPHDFQILCANCNWIKRATNNETPPGPPRTM